MCLKKILLFCLLSGAFELYAFRPLLYELPPLSRAVGVDDLTIIDPTRNDPHSEETLKRELELRLWFPAVDDPAQEIAQWGFDKRSTIIAELADEKGLPHLLVDFLYPQVSRSKENLRATAGKHPVVFLLHGLGGGTVEEHTALAEGLAAAGYFVIGIDFPFGALVAKVTQLGSVVKKSARLADLIYRYPASRPEITEYRKSEHNLWVEDLLFLTRTLPLLKDARFKSIDWDKLAIIGHSHGGMVALDSCLKVKNCQASVNMDGWTRGIEFPRDVKNHLLVFAPSTQDDASGVSFRNFCSGRQNCQALEIKNCDLGHAGFSDMIYLRWPLSYITKNKCGKKSLETAQVIQDKILTFLKGSQLHARNLPINYYCK